MRVPGGVNRRFAGGVERVFEISLVLVKLKDAIKEEGKSMVF